MKNLFKARIAHILGIAALVVIMGLSFTSCEEERPSGTGWPSNDIVRDYALPTTQPTEASSISWEVDEDDDLVMYLNWASSGRTIDTWLESEGWGNRDPATGTDSNDLVAYVKAPWVLAYGSIGTNRYLILIRR